MFLIPGVGACGGCDAGTSLTIDVTLLPNTRDGVTVLEFWELAQGVVGGAGAGEKSWGSIK